MSARFSGSGPSGGAVSRAWLLAPGAQLSGYTVVRRLALGGMSDVLLARAPDGREVVLKVLLPHLAQDPKIEQMFRCEAELAAMLEHPGLAKVHGFAREGEMRFIVMEHVDGLNLRAIVKSLADAGQAFPRDAALHIARAVCEVLAYVHDHVGSDGRPTSIVHRDVSLENILVTRTGQVKLLDFGIAKAAFIALSTTRGKLKGKVSYMAPELLLGASADRRSDIYALGVVLYTLLLMRRPYRGNHPGAVLRQIHATDPPPPRAIDPQLSEELERIVLKAMQRDPRKRYQSAHELRWYLDAAIQSSEMAVTRQRVIDFLDTRFPQRPSLSLGGNVKRCGRAAERRPVALAVGRGAWLRPRLRQVLLFGLVALLGLASGALVTFCLGGPTTASAQSVSKTQSDAVVGSARLHGTRR
jgi:serine/threonine protein kinase